MIIAVIFAADLHNAIGKNNQLLWNLPGDLKFFKNTTMGCPVIMGRKTYESMNRPLPGRRNMIVTRDTDYKVEGVEVYHSIEAAVEACRKTQPAYEKIFIIGGAEIFKQSFHMTDEIYRTVVKEVFDGDTFVPPINEQEFKMDWEECHEADEKNKFAYCFQKWLRKN